MAKRIFRCTATGDAMITKRLPKDADYEGFGELRDFIAKGAFRFTNLETTVHNFESFPSAQSGGSWLCSPPGVIDDVKAFAINIVSTANNHALDYAYGGLERTLAYLREKELPASGTGMNLYEASAPAYLDTPEARYALVSCCMTYNPGDMAGEQTKSMQGRPGMNVVRTRKEYRLPPEQLALLDSIAEMMHFNDYAAIIRKEGYLQTLKSGEHPFGPLTFHEGEKAEVRYIIEEEDFARIESAIREARFMADYVVVSLHNHETYGEEKENVDPLSIDFAHRCIDAGADAIIGTGPHLLRPMEIYKGKPIFYCLGDFIIQLETILRAPHDMFKKQKLDGRGTLDEMFNLRSDYGKKGLSYDRKMFEAVIPYWEVADGELTKLLLMPIEENFDLPRSQNGFPRPKKDTGILERFAKMSAAYGVRIEINAEGLGEVILGNR